MKFLSAAIFLIVGGVLMGSVSAQTDAVLKVSGTIKDEDSGRKLPGCMIIVFQDGEEFDRLVGDKNANYTFELPLRYSYTFSYSRDGFVTKKVVLDVSNIPDSELVNGFGFDLDMSLFKNIEGFDETILDTPIGLGTYNPDTGKFEFDMDHTERVKLRISNEKNRIQAMVDNRAKNKRAFDVAMKAGDNALNNKVWQEALTYYEEALTLIPEENDAIEGRDKARSELDAISNIAAEAAADAEKAAAAEAASQAAAAEAASQAAAAEAASQAAAAEAAAQEEADRLADEEAERIRKAEAAADADKAAAEKAASQAAAAEAAKKAEIDAANREVERKEIESKLASEAAAADARRVEEEHLRQSRLDAAEAEAANAAAVKRNAEEAKAKRAALIASSSYQEIDEAEEYYKAALKSEYLARAEEIQAKKQAELDMRSRREEEAVLRKDVNIEELDALVERTNESESLAEDRASEALANRNTSISDFTEFTSEHTSAAISDRASTALDVQVIKNYNKDYDHSVEKNIQEMYYGNAEQHNLEIQDTHALIGAEENRRQGAMDQRRIDSSVDGYDSRQALYKLNSGDEPTSDGTPAISDMDAELPQGFYESSYKIQNGIVVERTIRNGDKVIHYRKVVMKTGTYYFRDSQSITSSIWHRETTVVHD